MLSSWKASLIGAGLLWLTGIASASAEIPVEGELTILKAGNVYEGEIAIPGASAPPQKVFLEANHRYKIQVLGRDSRGGTLPDPELYVVAEDLTVKEYGDDQGEMLDPSIIFIPRISGEYLLIVRDLHTGTGTYTTFVDDLGALKITKVRVGELVRGHIKVPGDAPAYEVDLEQGSVYRIESLGRGDFDPALTLIGPDSKEIETNDDGPMGYGSLIEFVAQQSGTYQIFAGSFDGQLTGRFIVSVDGGEKISKVATKLKVGMPIVASLNGKERALFSVDLQAGRTYTIQVQGCDGLNRSLENCIVDPILKLTDSVLSRVEVENESDDSPENLDPLLEVTPQQSGTYYLRVESVDGEGQQFTIQVIDGRGETLDTIIH